MHKIPENTLQYRNTASLLVSVCGTSSALGTVNPFPMLSTNNKEGFQTGLLPKLRSLSDSSIGNMFMGPQGVWVGGRTPCCPRTNDA